MNRITEKEKGTVRNIGDVLSGEFSHLFQNSLIQSWLYPKIRLGFEGIKQRLGFLNQMMVFGTGDGSNDSCFGNMVVGRRLWQDSGQTQEVIIVHNGLPKYHGALALYYNKDIFDKYSVEYPNETWSHDDYLTAMKRLTHDRDGDGQTDLWGSMVDISWDRIQMHVNGWGGHFVVLIESSSGHS